ncbi:MAG: type III-B CRISPR-associated protein Cas10/Cmr2 [Pyrinomonadaceae bacterium]|nr:type III-B CRISPR-associated protein Cas10/Cmr2 [Pyrinomonadaceae bacterium]
MKKYLVQIQIGPVQDFIAAARRERDLHSGSAILCKLVKKVLDELGVVSLIFPYPEDVITPPNKVIFTIEVNSPEELVERISEVREKVYSFLDKKVRELLRGVDKIDLDIVLAQIKDAFEFYWVAVEIKENYVSERIRLNYLIKARKFTRDFRQVALEGSKKTNAWGANKPKSSLDGSRESVIPEEEYPKPGEDQDRKKAKELFRKYRIRENERLCGVGLLKRFYRFDNSEAFPSTAHVAALPLIKSAKNSDEARQAVKDFKKKLVELGLDESELRTVAAEHSVLGRMDGYFLFEERMADFFDGEKLEKAKSLVREMMKKVFGEGRAPIPYYSILLADGDSIGKIIDGIKDEDSHREFSKALSEFAESVRKIVNETYEGYLIYAGGDDVLALMPLHTVLECAEELSCEFKKKLEGFGKESISPSISIGIAVCHYLEPLQNSLENARLAEREAKSVSGKDGLAILVDKRSGETRIVKDKTLELCRRLSELIDFDRKGEISHQAAYALLELARVLECSKEDIRLQGLHERKLKSLEVRRILKRKILETGGVGAELEKFRKLFELVKKENGVRQLADELVIARIFTNAKKQAEGEI